MKSFVFHIGASKCGSSSIQSYATHHLLDGTTVNKDGKRVKYYSVIIKGDNISIIGNDKFGSQDQSQYLSSADMNFLKGRLKEILKRLWDDMEDNTIAVLSCEGWAKSLAADPGLAGELDAANLPIDVFFATRPPISWLNSAWTQWGVFGEETMEQWLTSQMNRQPALFDFFTHYYAWKLVRPVRQIKVVDISQDPLLQFQEFLGLEPQPMNHQNVSTHPGLMHYIAKYQKQLGRTLHNSSPEVQISQILQLPGRKSPVYIPEQARIECAEKFGDRMEKLIGFMDVSDAERASLREKYVEGKLSPSTEFRDWNDGATDQEKDEIIEAFMLKVIRRA